MLKWLLDKISGREAGPPSPQAEAEHSAPPVRTPDPTGIHWREADQERFLREAVLPRLNEAVLRDLTALLASAPGRLHPLDAAVLYAMAGAFEPTRLMETGSGGSTLVLNKARHDFRLPGELISTDPGPAIDLTEIVDAHAAKGAASLHPEDFAIFQRGEFLLLHLFSGDGEAAAGLRHVVEELLPELPEGVLLGVLGWPEEAGQADSWPEEARHALAVLLNLLRAHPPLDVYTSPSATKRVLSGPAGVLADTAPSGTRPGLLLVRLSALSSV